MINKCILNNEFNTTNVREQNETNYNKNIIDSTNKQTFSSVASEFNSTYRVKFGEIKKSIFTVIVNEENAKLINKKFLEELIIK